MSWSSIEFSETIRRTAVDRDNQILSAEIQPSGRFPVIDQGQAFIAGYSDAEERVIRDDLPLIIFGDHTRCLKYVDFPFILGADGTKVLKPKEELFDAKFFYHALLNLDIPNRGYNRHFTLLKEKYVPRPEKDEQRKIAAVLGLVQLAIEQQERLIALTTELKKSLMHKLFTEGLRGEPQKQTEIGPVPESWEICKIGDHCTSSAFGPRFSSDLYESAGNVLTLRTTDLDDDGSIDYSKAPKARINLEKFESHLLKTGDVVVSRSGTCGIAAVFQGHAMPVLPGAFLIRLRLTSALLPQFLRHYINSTVGRPRIMKLAQGAIQKNISGTALKYFEVPVPSLHEQANIVEHVEAIDRKLWLHTRKKQALSDLFRTLLHQLMTAQIRVHDLDLSGLA
jgi:type I restriction enzyme S subunit